MRKKRIRKYLIERTDGILQRYKMKSSSIKKYIKYDYKLPKLKKFKKFKYYYKKVKVPEKIKLYRYSYAINFPLHKKYYGCIGQIWQLKKNENAKEFLKENTKKFLIKCLGFSEENLWFDMALEGEGWQTVIEDKEFINYWEKRYENEKGITIKRDNGHYAIP